MSTKEKEDDEVIHIDTETHTKKRKVSGDPRQPFRGSYVNIHFDRVQDTFVGKWNTAVSDMNIYIRGCKLPHRSAEAHNFAFFLAELAEVFHTLTTPISPGDLLTLRDLVKSFKAEPYVRTIKFYMNHEKVKGGLNEFRLTLEKQLNILLSIAKQIVVLNFGNYQVPVLIRRFVKQ